MQIDHLAPPSAISTWWTSARQVSDTVGPLSSFDKLFNLRARPESEKAERQVLSRDLVLDSNHQSSTMMNVPASTISESPWPPSVPPQPAAGAGSLASVPAPSPVSSSARFQQLLKVKLAAESRRASSPLVPHAATSTAPLNESWKQLRTTNTVFNREFVAPHYTGSHVQIAKPDQSARPDQIEASGSRLLSYSERPSDPLEHTRDEMQVIPCMPPTFAPPPEAPMALNDELSTDFRTLVLMRIANMYATSEARMQEEAVFDAPPNPVSSVREGFWEPMDGPSHQEPMPYQHHTQAKFGEVTVKVEEVQDAPLVPVGAWKYGQQELPPPQAATGVIHEPSNFDSSQSAYPFLWDHGRRQEQRADGLLAPCPRDEAPPRTPSAQILSTNGLVSPPQNTSAVFQPGTDRLRLPPSYASLNLTVNHSPESRIRDTTQSPSSSISSSYSHRSSKSLQAYAPSPYPTVNNQVRLPSGSAYVTTAAESNGNANGSGGGDYHQGGASGSTNGSNGGSAEGLPNGLTLNFGDGGANGSGDGQGDDDQDPNHPRPKKLSLACHFCRRRKLKCDGKRPECENCSRRGETCSYDDNVRRRGPGKRTKEMRERAAREAEAAGLVNDNSANTSGGLGDMDVGLAINASLAMETLGNEAGPSTLAEVDETGIRRGRKRKSEVPVDGDKRTKLEGEELTESDVHALQELEHLDESAFGSIDPALQHISESLAGAQSVAYHVDHGHGPSGYVHDQGNGNGDGVDQEHEHLLA